MIVTFEHSGQIVEAEVTEILDDGATVAIEIIESDWTESRTGWEIPTADLRPRCECGNPLRLCHPDA